MIQFTDMIPCSDNLFAKIARRRKEVATSIKTHRRQRQQPKPQQQEHTDNTCASDKRVRFGRDSVAVFELPKTSQPQHDEQPTIIDKTSLWYNKKELNEQFLKDLESQLQDQISRAQSDYQYTDYYTSDNSNGTTSSRGLEFHFAHNQRRQDRAAAYVKHIVEKSYEIRKTALRQRHLPTTKLGRHIHKKRLIGRQGQGLADEIGEYAAQYTWMTRDLALGVAAEDEAEARAIYQEKEGDEEIASSTSTKEGCNASCTSNEFLACRPPPPAQLNRPRSFTAKSA